jgi:hypothetical protein
MKYVEAFWFNNQNFGDALNPWLISKILKKNVIFCNDTIQDVHLVCIGSILNWATPKSIVIGAGLADMKDCVNPNARVLSVRGPISGMRCVENGLNDPKIYGDPALLIPKFYTPKIQKNNLIGVIPHYTDQKFFFNNYLKFPKEKFKFINVFDCVEKVIDDICSCKQILSSSLHGLIVADAFNIPSLYVKMDSKIGGDGMKYQDYFLSVGIKPYNAVPIQDCWGENSVSIKPNNIKFDSEKYLKLFEEI